MDKEVKDRWVTALRSGKYVQGKKALCCDGKYCCLGVLAEEEGLLVDGDGKNGRVERVVPYKYGGGDATCSGILPGPVVESLGLGMCQLHLSSRNDRGDTFETLADWIDRNL